MLPTCIATLMVMWMLPREARVGTYSAFVRFHDGYAVTVDISIGSMQPHSAEGPALERRRAALDELLTPADDALMDRLVQHYLTAAHPYQRTLGLIRRGPSPWKTPEQMWASELVTHEARIPLPKPVPAEDGPGPVLLPSPSAWPRPERASLWLYLETRQPYHLRSVISGHLVASQLASGGLLARPDAISPQARPDDLRDGIQAYLEERNSHTLIGLLAAARAAGDELNSLCTPGPNADPRIAAAALILRSAVDGKPLGPDFAALAEKLGEDHRIGLLLASLTPDDRWESVRARFERLLARLELPS